MENIERDFIITTGHILKIFPHYSKKYASDKIWILKKKLNKQKNSVLLATELCMMLGISYDKLIILLK